MRRSAKPIAWATALVLMMTSYGASAQPAGPLTTTTVDRMAMKLSFKRFLALSNAGDPAATYYLAPGFSIDATDTLDLAPLLHDPHAHGIMLTAFELLLDDGGEMLAAELEFRRAAGASAEPPVRKTIFYTIKDGRLTSAHIGRKMAQFIPGNGKPTQRTSPIAAIGPMPFSASQPFMTRRKFEDYLALFGRFDERFVQYYHPEMLFGIAPTSQPLHGREEVLSFYRPLRKRVGESVVVNMMVIDSARGLMAVEMTNTLSATDTIKLPSATMQAGDSRVATGVLFYSIADGMITNIRY